MSLDTVESTLVWLRRDLRCEDHAALHRALTSSQRVWCVFVYDTDILDELPRRDRRVAFIHAAVAEVDRTLREWAIARGAAVDETVGLIVRHGRAEDEIPRVAQQLGVQRVVVSHDDEPQALARDARVEQALARQRMAWSASRTMWCSSARR